MKDQLCTEALQRALGAELLVKFQAQSDLPAEIEGAASDGLLIRDRIVRLEEQCDGQLRGRDAWTSKILTIKRDKIFVPKPDCPVTSQQPVEGRLAYVISIRVVWTKEITLRLSVT